MPASQVRFWRQLASRYNLIGCRCGKCKTVYFPPRTVCIACKRESIGKLEQYPLIGEGEVVSYTVVHTAPPEFEMQVPYALAVIKLREGPQLLAQIVDLDPGQVRIGLQVRAVFRKIGSGGDEGVIQYGYKFRPAREGPELGKEK